MSQEIHFLTPKKPLLCCAVLSWAVAISSQTGKTYLSYMFFYGSLKSAMLSGCFMVFVSFHYFCVFKKKMDTDFKTNSILVRFGSLTDDF